MSKNVNLQNGLQMSQNHFGPLWFCVFDGLNVIVGLPCGRPMYLSARDPLQNRVLLSLRARHAVPEYMF